MAIKLLTNIWRIFPNAPIVRRNFPFVWSIHPPLQLQGSL